MCGIAGIVKYPGGAADPWNSPRTDRSALHAMSAAIAHRGPDGSGMQLFERAALIHRRLAIIDLPGGVQPMANEDGRVWVVFNGEIYNHAELRRELQAAGHRFRTDHSDTEVLVHGWEAWGEALPSRLRGMFAFGIWDERGTGLPPGDSGADSPGGSPVPRGTLFLARDRMGQKPLFYAVLEDGLVFGSTVPSVLAWPEVPRRVPRELVGLYLQLGYVPPGAGTIYRDVQQVVPGHWVRVRGEVLDGGAYWKCGMRNAECGMGEGGEERGKRNDESGEVRLREVLSRAVESQLVADVPIACFLSGGIDSSIVAALMQEAVGRRGGGAIHTVSVGFGESDFDETAYAAAVAKKIGSRHTRLEVKVGGADEVMGTLEKLMGVLGQPFADSSILPTHHLSVAVRGMAPVALSGDGADELFGGYDRYRAMGMLSRWKNVARLIPPAVPMRGLAKKERLRRLRAAAWAGTAFERYTRLVEICEPAMVEELLGVTGEELLGDPGAWGELSPVRMAMRRDQAEYLPGDVLWKVDTAAMACALEVRSPFMDHGVVEMANGLPESALFAGGRGKAILRAAFAAELPAEVAGRGKKGFGVPMGVWFRGSLRAALHEALLGPGFVRTHLNVSAVRRMIEEHEGQVRDHTHRLFSLLMLELWAREFQPTME